MWKKIPRWLKWGIIAVGLDCVFILFSFIYNANCESDFCNLWLEFALVPGYLVVFPKIQSVLVFSDAIIVTFFNILVLFIGGTLIGLITEKIKSKK